MAKIGQNVLNIVIEIFFNNNEVCNFFQIKLKRIKLV